MYRLMKNHLPGPLADLIMAVWYIILLALIVTCVTLPARPFLYLGI